MINALGALFVFFLLLFLLALSVIAGRKFGRQQLARNTEHKLEVVNVAEGAVFALLGLLVAFTFSGAYDRFELRKTHIIEEANAYEIAYQRLDLLVPKNQDELRNELRLYLDIHLRAYKAIPYFKKVYQDQIQAEELQNKIWKTAVKDCKENGDQDLTQLVLPALNNMFEMANYGLYMTLVHPPLVIFVLLVGLAILGAFLVGYSTAESKARQSIHIVSYVLLTSFTIYIIINLELPRMGLIRVNNFDHILVHVRDRM